MTDVGVLARVLERPLLDAWRRTPWEDRDYFEEVHMKERDRMVYPRPDGSWGQKRLDAGRAASVHSTQREAQSAARRMLGRSGGGELITQGEDGRIRDKVTVRPGRDTFPPAG